MRQRHAGTTLITLLALFAATVVLGCVIVPTFTPVPSTFMVTVVDWKGRPLQGAEVELSPASEAAAMGKTPGDVRLTTKTDASGLARFSNVPFGAYHLILLRRDTEIQYVQVGNAKREAIPFRWPSIPVLTATTLRGRLLTTDLQPLHVTLTSSDSEKEQAAVLTDANGQFEFPTTVPGIYFLRVRYAVGRPDEVGEIAVDLDPAAKNSALDVGLSFTDCGLKYVDARACVAETPIEVPRVCGEITDSMGAVVRRDVSLRLTSEQPDETPVRFFKPTEIGTFEMPGVRPGRYKLFVSAPGFYPLEVPLRVTGTSSAGRCGQPLSITMGVWDECSKADVRAQIILTPDKSVHHK